jgi:predicted DNA-binding protein
MTEPINKLRGEHCLNIFVSFQLKQKIMELAEKYDRTMADMVRTLLRVGIPVMEGLTEAEERLLRDSIQWARKARKVKQMKLEEEGYENEKLKTEL